MTIRKEAEKENGAETGLTPSQEMAEALSLYRSAMRHVAEKHAARPLVKERKAAWSLRMRLVMVPALAAALAIAVIVPAMSHHGHPRIKAAPAVAAAPQATNTNVAQMNDTQLMDQIDSDLTEDVPDALQPLADMGTQTATATSSATTEKK